jgi:hypothetical protein
MAAASVSRQQGRVPEIQEQRLTSKRFIPLAIKHMERICSDGYDRTMLATAENVGKTTKDLLRLNAGIWYPRDCFKALKRQDFQDHIVWLAKEEAFVNGWADADSFEAEEYSDERLVIYKPRSFRLKEGVKPSSALTALDQKLSILDCGTVCILAYFRALHDVLRTEKFDQLFSKEFLFNYHLGSLENLILDNVAIRDESEIQEGDICRFENIGKSTSEAGKTIPGYHETHPFDHGGGWNVLRSGGAYLGFGLPTSKPVKGKDIEDALFQAYLEKPFLEEEAIPPAVWEAIPQVKPVHITREEFDAAPSCGKQIHQKSKLSPHIVRFDLKKIQALMDADIDKVEAVFASFKSG